MVFKNEEKVDLLEEQLTEKTRTQINVIDLPKIFEYEFFIKVKDFERGIIMNCFFGLVCVCISLIL